MSYRLTYRQSDGGSSSSSSSQRTLAVSNRQGGGAGVGEKGDGLKQNPTDASTLSSTWMDAALLSLGPLVLYGP